LGVRRTGALAAGVVGARDQRAVDEADLALGEPLGDAELHGGNPRRQAPQPTVVLRLVGQMGKQPGSSRSITPKN
jgi:hypothetical protein